MLFMLNISYKFPFNNLFINFYLIILINLYKFVAIHLFILYQIILTILKRFTSL